MTTATRNELRNRPQRNPGLMRQLGILNIDSYRPTRDTRERSWLRHCATSRKVVGSMPDDVIDIILPAVLWPWIWLSL